MILSCHHCHGPGGWKQFLNRSGDRRVSGRVGSPGWPRRLHPSGPGDNGLGYGDEVEVGGRAPRYRHLPGGWRQHHGDCPANQSIEQFYASRAVQSAEV